MRDDDEDDIRLLILRYATLLDGGDLDGVAALFASATWQGSPEAPLLAGATAVRRVYDGVVLYDGAPRTRHMITNIVVDVDLESHTASSTSYFTVMHAPPGGTLQPVMAGTYEDTFDRALGVHGAWRFASRLIRPDLAGDLSTHYRP